MLGVDAQHAHDPYVLQGHNQILQADTRSVMLCDADV